MKVSGLRDNLMHAYLITNATAESIQMPECGVRREGLRCKFSTLTLTWMKWLLKIIQTCCSTKLPLITRIKDQTRKGILSFLSDYATLAPVLTVENESTLFEIA